MWNRSLFAALIAMILAAPLRSVHAEDPAAPEAEATPADTTASDVPAPQAASAPEPDVAAPATESAPARPAAKKGKRLEQADSFVAPANWEFDGFVAGGKDQEVRNMFYLNDLVYLNIGSDQGFTTGVRVQFFKKGDKVRDPQSGKLLGFEVRRTAIGQVTDRVDAKTCSVRILKANEAVEVGDLVRRQD